MPALRWTVSQLGARQHYGIPRGFEMAGNLRALYTDVWCHHGRTLLSRGPLAARSWAGRYHPGIPSGKVTSFSAGALWQAARARGAKTIEEDYYNFMRVGEWFCRRVNARIEHEPFVPGLDAFYGFNTASLETIDQFRGRDVLTIVDQIDPGPVEERMVREEALKWPGWQETPGRIPDEYFQRIAREWKLADLVVVNSRWSRSALLQEGIDASKLIVAPVGYELPPEAGAAPRQRDASAALRVLWVGTVNLRKGIQYLIEAAKLLVGERIEFIIAGPLAISDDAVASAPASVSFRGRISRAQAAELYRDADLFVLPTVSDGFAITQLEAMSFGLPVVTTPNCGDVVTDTADGLIVPACDASALAKALIALHRDRAFLRAMSIAAPLKAGEFGLREQARHLEGAIQNWMHGVLSSV